MSKRFRHDCDKKRLRVEELSERALSNRPEETGAIRAVWIIASAILAAGSFVAGAILLSSDTDQEGPENQSQTAQQEAVAVGGELQGNVQGTCAENEPVSVHDLYSNQEVEFLDPDGSVLATTTSGQLEVRDASGVAGIPQCTLSADYSLSIPIRDSYVVRLPLRQLPIASALCDSVSYDELEAAGFEYDPIFGESCPGAETEQSPASEQTVDPNLDPVQSAMQTALGAEGGDSECLRLAYWMDEAIKFPDQGARIEKEMTEEGWSQEAIFEVTLGAPIVVPGDPLAESEANRLALKLYRICQKAS